MGDIVFDNVWKEYGDQIVLEKISRTIAPRAFVALVGLSGCGKTTFLKMLLGEEAPTRGGITLDGVPLVAEPGPDRGVVFQRYSVFPHLMCCWAPNSNAPSRHGYSARNGAAQLKRRDNRSPQTVRVMRGTSTRGWRTHRGLCQIPALYRRPNWRPKPSSIARLSPAAGTGPRRSRPATLFALIRPKVPHRLP